MEEVNKITDNYKKGKTKERNSSFRPKVLCN